MSGNTAAPSLKASKKKSKVAIPEIHFKPEEMKVIDGKNWVTVSEKSRTKKATPVKPDTNDLDKQSEKSKGEVKDVTLSDPNIKSKLDGEDDWQEVLTPIASQQGEDTDGPLKPAAKKKGWLGGVFGRK